ncbi:MAG: Yip1 family protein [Bacilli bacterium]
MNENNVMKPRTTKFDWQKVKHFLKFVYEEFIRFPTYILVHPLKGFDAFKRDKKAKMSVSLIFVALLIIMQILEFQYTGFVVNQLDLNDLNSFQEMASVIVPIIAVVVGNWSITTLFDGKGKMKEIFMMICYSLFPLIVSKIVGMLFSNIIVVEEAGFYGLIISLGSFLMGYMIFFGLISIHEYGLFKCLLSIVGTLLAVMVLFFIAMLGFDLFQKIIGFVYTLYREIALRYL